MGRLFIRFLSIMQPVLWVVGFNIMIWSNYGIIRIIGGGLLLTGELLYFLGFRYKSFKIGKLDWGKTD